VRDRRVERGSVLALVPAAVLVLALLGALAVDSAAAYLSQHQLSDAVAGAANDAATAALSDQAFYRSGELELDARSSATVVCASMAASLDAHLHLVSVELAIDGRWVHVRATALVRRVLLTGAPLVPPEQTVRASAAAVAVRSASDQVPDRQRSLAWVPVSCYSMYSHDH
jgi:hypothetical protein